MGDNFKAGCVTIAVLVFIGLAFIVMILCLCQLFDVPLDAGTKELLDGDPSTWVPVMTMAWVFPVRVLLKLEKSNWNGDRLRLLWETNGTSVEKIFLPKRENDNFQVTAAKKSIAQHTFWDIQRYLELEDFVLGECLYQEEKEVIDVSLEDIERYVFDFISKDGINEWESFIDSIETYYEHPVMDLWLKY